MFDECSLKLDRKLFWLDLLFSIETQAALGRNSWNPNVANIILGFILMWIVSLWTQPGLQGVGFGRLQSPHSNGSKPAGGEEKPPHNPQPAIAFLPQALRQCCSYWFSPVCCPSPRELDEVLAGSSCTLGAQRAPSIFTGSVFPWGWQNPFGYRAAGRGTVGWMKSASNAGQQHVMGSGDVLLLQAVLWGLSLPTSPCTRKKKSLTKLA